MLEDPKVTGVIKSKQVMISRLQNVKPHLPAHFTAQLSPEIGTKSSKNYIFQTLEHRFGVSLMSETSKIHTESENVLYFSLFND